MNDAERRQAILDFADKHLSPYELKKKADGTEEIVPEYCPICHGGAHGDKKSFALSVDYGVYVCKRGSCGQRGRFEALCEHFGEQPAENLFVQKKDTLFTQKAFDMPRMDELLPATEDIYRYFASRKISKDTVDAFRIRATPDGDITFPFYENGEVPFLKFRRTEKLKPGDKRQKEWRVPNTKAILFGLDMCVYSKPLVITEGQCFPGDAEILTPNGWQRLDMYDGRTMVCQVDENFKASFVMPRALIKKDYDGNLIAASIGGNYSSVTTPDHNIVLMNHRNGTVRKRQAKDVKHSTAELIPTTAILDGPGIPLKNTEIALYLAVCADGTIDVRKSGARYCRFTVQKQRKYDRMKSILDGLSIPYYESCDKTGRRHFFGFYVPEYIRDKHIPAEWIWQATLGQRLFILHEIVHWDGNHVVNRNQAEFSTRFEEDAIVIQTLAHTAGFMSTVMRRKQKYRYLGEERFGIVYKASLLWGKHHVSVQAWHPTEEAYKGKVYCVTVPSGMIMVRQNGHITVTGNCDAMSLYEAGVRNVVSVPSGCEDFSWVEHCWDQLEKFKSIIFFGDEDEPGRKMVREAAHRLDESRCLFVENYPFRPGTMKVCKDANEILYFYGGMKLIQMVEEAREAPIRGLINLGDTVPSSLDDGEKIYTRIPALDKALKGLRMGAVTVWSGKAGHGKSTLTGLLELQAIEQGYNVCVYSGELTTSEYQTWVDLQCAGRDYIGYRANPAGEVTPVLSYEVQQALSAYYNRKLWLYDNQEIFEDDESTTILKLFTAAYRRYDCRLFVVDNLMMALADSDDELRDQKRFVNKLKKFARKYNVHVMVVAHPRKTKKDERLDNQDIAGSMAVGALADATIIMERPNIRVVKNRITGQMPLIECVYCPDSRRIYQMDAGDKNHFSWNKTNIPMVPPEKRAAALPEFDIQLPVTEPF